MKRYVVLLRGINVGGKNKISMASLRYMLEQAGFKDVMTYIQSGNVILDSSLSQKETERTIEELLPRTFQLDSSTIKALALSRSQLSDVIRNKPVGFGDTPDIFHSDVIFVMDGNVPEALKVFNPREGVDKIWPGNGVIYSQRLSAERTRSRLNKIIGTPAYQLMTIRNWNTVMKLYQLLEVSAD